MVVFVALQRLIRSRYGRGLVAARENELAAISMGVNVAWYRTLSFCIAAGCAGIAGSLYAHFFSYISPDSFTILQSIAFLTMVVIGVLAASAGAVIGAFFVFGVPEMLRTLAEYRILIFGPASGRVHDVLAGGTGGPGPPVAVRIQTEGRNS